MALARNMGTSSASSVTFKAQLPMIDVTCQHFSCLQVREGICWIQIVPMGGGSKRLVQVFWIQEGEGCLGRTVVSSCHAW